MAQAIDLSSKDSYLKVVFSFDILNNNFQEKYTDLPEDLPNGFQSATTMKVTLPKNTGTLEKKVCAIELPADTFMLRLTNGIPHAPIFCVIQEIIVPHDPADNTTVLTPFRGRLMKAKENPPGKPGMVRLTLQRPKSRLKVQTGLPVMHHCPFDPYGAGSQLNRVNFRALGPNDTIVGNVVTMLNDPGEAPGYFKDGYVEFEGLTIKVREWDDAKVYTLIEEPPASWAGAQLAIYAGSNHTIEDVRDKLGNEEHFGGIGYKIPPYHPSVEDSP